VKGESVSVSVNGTYLTESNGCVDPRRINAFFVELIVLTRQVSSIKKLNLLFKPE
jgi:hypothetical protein